MLINLLVAYNCVIITLSISFEVESEGLHRQFDNYFVEVMFGLDILFNFLMEIRDPETQQPVRELVKIAKNYVFHGSFLFDFLAIFPIKLIVEESSSSVNKILRMVRISRLLKLLDIARFNHSLKSFFENDSSQDKIMLQYVIMHSFKITRLFLAAIIITYFCGCLWFLVVFTYKDPGLVDDQGFALSDPTFYYEFEMDKMSS